MSDETPEATAEAAQLARDDAVSEVVGVPLADHDDFATLRTEAETMARSPESASSKRYEESSRSGEVSPFEAGQPDYPPVLEPGDPGYPTTSDPHSSAPVEHGAPSPE